MSVKPDLKPVDFIATADIKFADYPTRVSLFAKKKHARAFIKTEAQAIKALSHKLYAQSSQSLLIVLQGMDTSGKDGSISALFSATPPLNLSVASFKKPSPVELSHDYLWRAHKHCPAKGNITVFNRSHYEDVLVVKVRKFAKAEAIKKRYRQINDFERHLHENGTHILKFMLNISKDRQKKRLEERLVEPHKLWKFNPGDLEDRMLWPQFMSAYKTMIKRTSTQAAPWHVIPSDSRSARNAIICSIVRQKLEEMAPQYPNPGYKPGDFLI